jgi:capsular polysaccharide biosynthesis protein
MSKLLLLGALAGWGYDGFASDPGDHPVNRSEPAVLPTPHTPAPPAAPVAPPPAVAPGVATVWRLADAAGQVWEHADLPTLQRFIHERNDRLRYARP